jgi:hydrogenase expression/formation protein HypE
LTVKFNALFEDRRPGYFKERMMKNNDTILLDHGAGGKVSHSMFSEIILPLFDNTLLAKQDDGAVFDVPAGRMAFSTDSYTVDPIFFPGGDIGELAVNGTVNDVAMCGATPLYISVGLIIEEGMKVTDLKRILQSMAGAAQKAGIRIVTGDTKVVPRGKVDKIFINTSGIGLLPEGVNVSGQGAKPGDKVIVSGTIADHGVTILSEREGLKFDSDVKSDSAPLNHMVKAVLESGYPVHVLRDPTRGGLGTTLNEIAVQSSVGIRLFEERLPVRGPVQGICELLGFDPLYLANEGKLIAIIPEADANNVLDIIRRDEFGKDAVVVGEVIDQDPGRVVLETLIGGTRIVDMLTGEQLPRIC